MAGVVVVMGKLAVLRIAAVAMILAGMFIGARVVYSLNHEVAHDSAQDKAWQHFMGAATGQAPGAVASPAASPGAPGGIPDGLYLKMTLLGKEAIAVDGDWNSLRSTSTVHYRGSAAPGQKGNMLIAFHREPKWIDFKVQPGDIVQIEALDRKSYKYKVEYVRIVGPADVNGLKPTTGTDLTLITCDPPWQDYHRMVVRAHLVPS